MKYELCYLQGLSKQEPELKNQLETQKQKVKNSAPNKKKLKELETRVETSEKSNKQAFLLKLNQYRLWAI